MRIAFITDAHIGASADGYQMQPRWIEGTTWLLEQLVRRMYELVPDLIIIGGDTVECGIPEQIRQATAFVAQLPAQTLVCLGNHDLTERASFETWRESLAGLDRVILADALVELPECDVIGLNTHWLNAADRPELHWTAGQYPRAGATEEQILQLRQWLEQRGGRANRPAILAMHSQINGVPAAVCGRDTPYEPPTPSFEAAVRQAITPCSRLRLTLSGHCHVACAIRHNGRVELTGTSFTERPFQFHLIDLQDGQLRIQTQRIACEQAQDLVAERLWVCQNATDIQRPLRLR